MTDPSPPPPDAGRIDLSGREQHLRREPIEHELKTWPDFFRRVLSGEKTFELRKADRDFRAGDTLWLREYVKGTDTYTGRDVRRLVTYLLGGGWPGLQDGYVVMAIAPLDDQLTLLRQTVEQQQQELAKVKDTLRALNAIVPQMDNGYCAICRLQGSHGYRSADTRGNVLVNCSNDECLSYRIAAALAGNSEFPIRRKR